jgi:sulfur transfer complex TusBCD TusB component (DsrH family)
MSFSLVFKQCLFSLVLSILSENANFVLIEKLITFYKNLSSEQHLIFLPLHLYHLYGGGQFTIDAAIFKNKLTALIEGLGKVLATSDTIISRNIEQFKASKQRRVLLDESVRVVLISKDKTALPDFVTQVC